ncbi:hypothetical protein K239x_18820 [Planctomycetes bacterium K23_9]|uniref:Uncharacterized protein n=2 Tax=Stieleria marina TaxID=1930275 RepID=A0A517NS55_9BACT|nr:hypothetical protein K239x_18820 [Planctomycetes bacterium K23_9]
MGGSDALSNSWAGVSNSGVIRDDAAHWAIEPYVPIETRTLQEYLVGRKELDAAATELFKQRCDQIENLVHHRTGSYHTQFADLYSSLDPDLESLVPKQTESHDVDLETHQLMATCDEILMRAGYRRLEQSEIEKCVGVASQWGVPLHVNFELFEHLAVYARGDVVGTRLRRRLRKLYQPEQVEVPIYQRMVVLFELCDDSAVGEELAASALHLRMFKNIPKLDVDMLLPCTRVRLSKIDRAKIIVPSLGGWLLSMRKIAQIMFLWFALAYYSAAVIGILILAGIGYLIKSVFSYLRTKDKHLLDLTRNLYFQKLDTNAGVAYRMIQQAHRQSIVESMLAYHAIATHDEPISTRRLRRKCERILREAIDVEIAFQVDRALVGLCEIKAIKPTPDGKAWIVHR